MEVGRSSTTNPRWAKPITASTSSATTRKCSSTATPCPARKPPGAGYLLVGHCPGWRRGFPGLVKG